MTLRRLGTRHAAAGMCESKLIETVFMPASLRLRATSASINPPLLPKPIRNPFSCAVVDEFVNVFSQERFAAAEYEQGATDFGRFGQ